VARVYATASVCLSASVSNLRNAVKEEVLIRRSFSVLLLLCCSAILASAAGNGQISGKVEDSSGAALSGVVVTVTDLTSGAVQHMVTGSDGSFTFNGLSMTGNS
jgi:hypothetical protein